MGFRRLPLGGVYELVYGKVIHLGKNALSLRVYTGISESGGNSRAKGTDAIRLQFFWKQGDKPVSVGRTQKCLRVHSWQRNLRAAIDRSVDSDHFQVCDKCGAPMAVRVNSTTGAEFWGCVNFWETGCQGKPARREETCTS